jgi:hypothetical protein
MSIIESPFLHYRFHGFSEIDIWSDYSIFGGKIGAFGVGQVFWPRSDVLHFTEEKWIFIDFCFRSFFNEVSNERGLPVGLDGNKNRQWHLELVAEFHLERFFHLRKRQSEIKREK